mmetsp:Transcript_25073/g.50962  ORF Transcript_25073/g.50962 Transcript_25073/m.50962 type:complete len:342 (+) Transcript_25073:54-1079(+)
MVPRPRDDLSSTSDQKHGVARCPSLAQTHMQGPLNVAVNGSGKSLTRDELELVKKDLEQIKLNYNLKEPTRSFMDRPDTKWRFGGPPDYSLTNYMFLKQRTRNHSEGSLELIVENLVKTWEMERSHKVDCSQHESVDTKSFKISANGGKVYDNVEANRVGNYNVLLDNAPKELYDAKGKSWEESHDAFHNAFAAFPWEVLECYSGPPTVAFTWRHWGTYTGTYEGHQGQGQLVEMFGFGLATVNDKLQLTDVKIYYDSREFLEVMRGQRTPDAANKTWRAGKCPQLEEMRSAANENEGRASFDAKKNETNGIIYKFNAHSILIAASFVPLAIAMGFLMRKH